MVVDLQQLIRPFTTGSAYGMTYFQSADGREILAAFLILFPSVTLILFLVEYHRELSGTGWPGAAATLRDDGADGTGAATGVRLADIGVHLVRATGGHGGSTSAGVVGFVLNDAAILVCGLASCGVSGNRAPRPGPGGCNYCAVVPVDASDRPTRRIWSVCQSRQIIASWSWSFWFGGRTGPLQAEMGLSGSALLCHSSRGQRRSRRDRAGDIPQSRPASPPCCLALRCATLECDRRVWKRVIAWKLEAPSQ